MKLTDRTRLTTALREHVAKIAADLRTKMRGLAPGSEAVKARAKRLHDDERVAEDFDVWTDLLSRRAAVLWVLKSVYVRVLEDRGLLSPGRLLDPEAQQLFERLAPHLGETAFLRWIYRDLASARGGLPELFSPQPAEVAVPSDALSRGLIALWRHRDADTGAHWSFAEERFEGELMGDLYQDLDPVVKDRFALCQTPDFVRAFILDRTLTLAIETFGADKVRLLDPACGSGHFLIDGLKRLVAATAAQHPDWSRGKLALHALDRVVGIDLNDYACGLARTRLVMTAAELAGVTSLGDAAQFHPHVYWADGLEQVERDDEKQAVQTSLFGGEVEKPRAVLTRSDVRLALKKVLANKFHAVVANPPYITEKDAARKDYHREKIKKTQRYVSAYREYSLGSPFTERCFQLAEKEGFVGIITSNNFMKREFGKPLIETVLAKLDLTMVVDTSQAYIPFHGTPTVLIFGRNRVPSAAIVRAVMGKRGESGIPTEPAKGCVWSSVEEGWGRVGFENEYVSVADLSRGTLAKHPWSLGGGGAAELKAILQEKGARTLGSLADIGTGAVTREDAVYVIGREAARRLGVGDAQIRPLVLGNALRDWVINDPVDAIWPYDPSSLEAASGEAGAAVSRALWPWRSRLAQRVAYGKSQIEHGLQWFEYSMFFAHRFRTPLSIAFAKIATHNHLVLGRGQHTFSDGTPFIKLPAGASEEAHLALLGLLSSSAACFWMKQVFHPKGATSANRNHPDPERFAHEFSATGMGSFPVPATAVNDPKLVEHTRAITALALERTRAMGAAAWTGSLSTAAELREALATRWRWADRIRQSMVFFQEEIDWNVYALYGLTPEPLESPAAGSERLPRRHRAFERVNGRRSFVRVDGRSARPEDAECETGDTSLAEEYMGVVARREEAIRSNSALAAIEQHMFKRLWRDTDDNLLESAFRKQHDDAQLRAWMVARVEDAARSRDRAIPCTRHAADLMNRLDVQVVAELLTESRSCDIEGLIRGILEEQSIPLHPSHIYTDAGLAKRGAWEDAWARQRLEDAGDLVDPIAPPPEYSQGSRGKTRDFVRTEYWQLRGKLDVPKECFIAFTEVPHRTGAQTLYGWAGWTPLQRLRAILAIDEELDDGGVPIADRIGLLDSAWRLLPWIVGEDAPAATRLKAELQALVGPHGPSPDMVEDWRKRFPPPTMRTAKAKRPAAKLDVEGDTEESEES